MLGKNIVALIALIFVSSYLHALEWQFDAISADQLPGQKELVAAFPFKNTGSSTITLTSIESSCDCTSGHADVTTIPVNGSGKITLKFIPGERTGMQESSLVIKTDEVGAVPERIRLLVRIHDIALFSSRLLEWGANESRKEKRIEIASTTAQSINVQLGKASSKGVIYRLDSSIDGRTHQLSVRPPAGDAPIRDTIIIRVSSHEATQAYPVHSIWH